MSLDLNIDTQKEGDITVFHIQGELDDFHASKLNNAFADAIENDGATKLIINLDGANFIDSVGLGTIAIAAKKIVAQNGKIKVVCTKPQIQKLIDASGITSALSEHLQVVDSLDAAKAGF